MKKPYEEFNTFTVKDIEVRIKNEYDELISRIIKGENMEIIKDLLEKKESNFVHLLADMYVATYRIQHELNNIQQMINNRNDELNKLLDLYDQTLKLVQQKLNDYESGKPRADIIREYDLTASAFDKWVKQSQASGSFKEKDHRTPEEEELIKLRKENQRLMMENDILKQAALIMGRK